MTVLAEEPLSRRNLIGFAAHVGNLCQAGLDVSILKVLKVRISARLAGRRLFKHRKLRLLQ